MLKWIVLLGVLTTSLALGQRCNSIRFAQSGGWRPAVTAPRDGTVVEMMETYGIAPWYDIFKWSKDYVSMDVKSGKEVHFISATASWVSADKPGHSVTEDECLFWRPYKPTAQYADPTDGAQNSVAYWCAAAHRPYDPKTDRCK